MNTEVKSAARMLDLLEYLAGCAEPVKLKDIVATLGFPKSSAHALAQTLVSRGYAIQDSAERYVLVHASRHRSVLAVRNTRGEAKRLAKCVSRQAIRFDVDLDGQSDSYCTATGRLLLAHWDDALTDAYLARVPLVARTPKTPTDPDAIRALFDRILEEDISICDEEHVLGSTGLATPIRARDGSVVAALNLGVVTMRYHQRSDELIAMLKDAGRLISMRLGYREA